MICPPDEDQAEHVTAVTAVNVIPDLAGIGFSVNLTNIWKAAGSVPKKKPALWLQNQSTQEFIQQIQEETKPGNSQVLKTSPGKGGGTFAHWKLGLAYTAFLNPQVHSWFMDVVKERFEEMADPDFTYSSTTNSLRHQVGYGSGIDWN